MRVTEKIKYKKAFIMRADRLRAERVDNRL
jgi:tetrahydromethanopterin S-methyltransferase subunit F